MTRTMKLRSLIAAAVLAGLAVVPLLAHGGNRPQIFDLIRDAPADTLAASATRTSRAVPILGARQVTFFIRDSLIAAANATTYVDSLGGASIEVSRDSIYWHLISLNSFAVTHNDTLQISWQGKLLDIPLSQSYVTGGNRTGWLLVTLRRQEMEASGNEAASSPGIPYRYCRINLQARARPRHVTSTENASLIGLRCQAWVWYDPDYDPFVPPHGHR